MKDSEIEFLDNYDEDDKSIDATDWVPSIILHRKATEEDIVLLEQKLGVTIPEGLRDVLRDHQGDRPLWR